MTAEAMREASGELGWWGSYIKLVEDGVFALYDKLDASGVQYPYAISIIAFVFGVRLVVLPLIWSQLSSSSQMRSIKPQQDLVSKWYGDNDQLKQQAVGNLFEELEVNPLAGCLPSLAQIPAFLGVYYSVTSIAKAEIFTEGFLWIPSLSGPIADRREGLSWLTEGWIDGVPKLGWHDTLAYLLLPAILVVTQTISLKLLGSFEALDETDPTSKNVAIVLRFLPFMLGYFAMNAPSALGLYWVTNNVLTTATTVIIKKLVDKEPLEVADVDISALGPRRDPVPLPEVDMGQEWAPLKSKMEEALDAAQEAVEEAKAKEAAEEEAKAAAKA